MPSNSFNRHHHRDAFTDPFVLFDSIFGDFEQHFFDEFQRPHQRSNGRYRHHDPFGPGFPLGSSGMGGMLRGMGMSNNMFAGFPSMDLGPGSGSGRARWRQESRTTTTVNGVTHSKWTRVDSDGNEHVTLTFPDGQEEYRINGRIQPTEERGFLPGPPPNSMHPHEYNPDAIPPPPIITGHPSRSRRQPPEYDGPYSSVRPDDNWNDRDYRHAPEQKRRWWRGGR